MSTQTCHGVCSFFHTAVGSFTCTGLYQTELQGSLQTQSLIICSNSTSTCKICTWVNTYIRIFHETWIHKHTFEFEFRKRTSRIKRQVYVCLCVCMCVCLFVCVCVYVWVSVCVCVYLFVCVYVFVYVCLCVCLCVCIYVCVCGMGLYICVCVCVCVCLCMHVCMHACMILSCLSSPTVMSLERDCGAYDTCMRRKFCIWYRVMLQLATSSLSSVWMNTAHCSLTWFVLSLLTHLLI